MTFGVCKMCLQNKNLVSSHLISRRFIENWSNSHSHHMSGGAGRDFVPHEGGYEFYVVMRHEGWVPLMNALRDDVRRQLVSDGAKVLTDSGDPYTGFHFDYTISKSSGSINISPVVNTWPPVVHRKILLPDGMEDVTVKIEQTEKWFPKRTGTT